MKSMLSNDYYFETFDEFLKHNYRLNLMHAIGLIMNDDFLVQFNLSLSTENITDYFYKVHRIIFEYYKGSFIQKYKINFAKVLTPFGLCFTFNNMDSSEMFHINR